MDFGASHSVKFLIHSLPISPSQKTFEVINAIMPFTAKAMIYGDLTGVFPYTSSRGYKYIYLMYDFDFNAI